MDGPKQQQQHANQARQPFIGQAFNTTSGEYYSDRMQVANEKIREMSEAHNVIYIMETQYLLLPPGTSTLEAPKTQLLPLGKTPRDQLQQPFVLQYSVKRQSPV